ncbi:hypothetical protein DAPPUDRAFT_262508 [Daphnia pulex]|uniref:Uncharacterized protein n=1 Tax=Daphnia pulex TaxID=6669 RepID=E9HN43_DAPPU|nr:hypothetical protein DAPPUDRAFT_262508 [Daphnia pulex]|eukprot:EFX66838.1 hypothetical protein DAPPUDRAFT_262508 [Daphnia pulex]
MDFFETAFELMEAREGEWSFFEEREKYGQDLRLQPRLNWITLRDVCRPICSTAPARDQTENRSGDAERQIDVVHRWRPSGGLSAEEDLYSLRRHSVAERGAAGAAGEEQKKPVKNEKAVLRLVVLWWCRYCDTSNGTPAADEETLLGSHPTASAAAAETKLSSRRYTGRWTQTGQVPPPFPLPF